MCQWPRPMHGMPLLPKRVAGNCFDRWDATLYRRRVGVRGTTPTHNSERNRTAIGTARKRAKLPTIGGNLAFAAVERSARVSED